MTAPVGAHALSPIAEHPAAGPHLPPGGDALDRDRPEQRALEPMKEVTVSNRIPREMESEIEELMREVELDPLAGDPDPEVASASGPPPSPAAGPPSR